MGNTYNPLTNGVRGHTKAPHPQVRGALLGASSTGVVAGEPRWLWILYWFQRSQTLALVLPVVKQPRSDVRVVHPLVHVVHVMSSFLGSRCCFQPTQDGTQSQHRLTRAFRSPGVSKPYTPQAGAGPEQLVEKVIFWILTTSLYQGIGATAPKVRR